MKKFLFLMLLVSGLAISVMFPRAIKAASCDSVDITPSSSGPPNTTFELTAHCNADILAGEILTFTITGPLPDGLRLPNMFGLDRWEEGIYKASFNVLFEPGVYKIEIWEGTVTGPLIETNVTIEEDPENPLPTHGLCFSTAPGPLPICEDTGMTSGCCPNICPPKRDLTSLQWICTPTLPMLCSASDSSTGINTAIGCIPIEKIELTTEFFLKWSLGVGGGIALFLIALSGIKIMTTQGDPKRLQDARDMLSSAIAGLVLILLSIFLIRFISEELLKLF
jgi:hypothetical protein